jgi:hypothetical protein
VQSGRFRTGAAVPKPTVTKLPGQDSNLEKQDQNLL